MKAYKGTFRKKDGSNRTMKFLKLKDLPQDFLNSKFKGTKKQHVLSEGMELVWDIEENDFRMFNQNTALDTLEEFEYTFNQ